MAIRDAGATMQYLQNRQKENPSFYYAVQLNEDDLTTNIFWARYQIIIRLQVLVMLSETTYKQINMVGL